MKCVYCPIDTRLNFHQVSKLLKEVQVTSHLHSFLFLFQGLWPTTVIFIKFNLTHGSAVIALTLLWSWNIFIQADSLWNWFDSCYNCFIVVPCSPSMWCVRSSTRSLHCPSRTALIWCWSCSPLPCPTDAALYSTCPSDGATNVFTLYPRWGTPEQQQLVLMSALILLQRVWWKGFSRVDRQCLINNRISP